MAKPKSDFVSGMGTAFEILKRISDAVVAVRGGDEDMRRILSDPTLPPRIAGEIMRRGKDLVYTRHGPYDLLTLDYEGGAKMLYLGDYQVNGRVDLRDQIVSAHMPWRAGPLDCNLFQSPLPAVTSPRLGMVSFGDSKSGQEIIDFMISHGMGKATAMDLIAVLRRYPELVGASEICEILALAIEHGDADGATHVFGVDRGGSKSVRWLNAGKSLDEMGWGKIVWFLVRLDPE